MSDIVKSLDLGDYKEIRNKGKELISTLTQHQNNIKISRDKVYVRNSHNLETIIKVRNKVSGKLFDLNLEDYEIYTLNDGHNYTYSDILCSKKDWKELKPKTKSVRYVFNN